MGLTPGMQLGSCEILERLGAGGMGKMYRGCDTKLGRDVAVKALPDAFAHDANRRARFEREAQVLAGLNHPNFAVSPAAIPDHMVVIHNFAAANRGAAR